MGYGVGSCPPAILSISGSVDTADKVMGVINVQHVEKHSLWTYGKLLTLCSP